MAKAMSARGKRGEGSIFQRKDGTYCAKITLEGKTHYAYGATYEEASAKLINLRADALKGIMPVAEQVTLEQFITRWLADSVQPSVSVNTFKFYSDITRLYLLPSLGSKRLKSLTGAQLERLYRELLGRGLSPKTVREVHRVTHTALKKAVKWQLVQRNVSEDATPPRVPKAEVAILDKEQVRHLLSSVRGSRWEALICVALGTGMRQSELLGLGWDCVDFDSETVLVTKQLRRDGVLTETKTRKGRRIDLPPFAVAALKAHRARQNEHRLAAGPAWTDSGLVFTTETGKPLMHRNVCRAFEGCLQRAGLPRVCFHSQRHSAASLLLMSGEPIHTVSQMLGHSRTSQTLDRYGHLLSGAGKSAAQRLDSLLA